MVILHIASIHDNPFNGVCVAVPAHIRSEAPFATVALLNIQGEKIPDIACQLSYEKPFRLSSLQEPFCKPDLVVFHECYRIDYIAIAKQLQKEKIPYCILPHGELRREAQQKKKLKKWAANLLIFNRFINHAESLQCLSEAELAGTKFGKRKFIGTNGVSLPDIQKENFLTDGVQFTYIGRYEWRVKGLDILMDAVKMQETFFREHRCKFDLYGPDILGRMAAVQAMIDERNIGDLVTLHHEIRGKEKEKILLDSDIFIQTSRHEGMPMGILEALSYKLPCLITEGAVLGKEITAYNAGWVAKTDAASVAEALICAVKERALWHEKSENALTLIAENFLWEKIAQQEVRQYQELIK